MVDGDLTDTDPHVEHDPRTVCDARSLDGVVEAHPRNDLPAVDGEITGSNVAVDLERSPRRDDDM